MTQTNARLVGNSFRMGYRFQRYWDTPVALAFFFAEAGAGLFLVSFYFDLIVGMIVGVILVGTLKPYFHLGHMGVPKKSLRALRRPDRSWISRGALAIGLFVGFGVLYLIDRAFGASSAFGMSPLVGELIGYFAVVAALIVMCYQGLAMADSESFTLWASAFLPLSSFFYALTAGVLLVLVMGWNVLDEESRSIASDAARILLAIDLLVVCGLLLRAYHHSEGGKFSVRLLTRDEYAGWFVGVVLLLGLVLPLGILLTLPVSWVSMLSSALMMLAGFVAFRILMFKAAVFEPIMHDLAASIGLPGTR